MNDSLLFLNCGLKFSESLLANSYLFHELLLLSGHVPHDILTLSNHSQELCIST